MRGDMNAVLFKIGLKCVTHICCTGWEGRADISNETKIPDISVTSYIFTGLTCREQHICLWLRHMVLKYGYVWRGQPLLNATHFP